MTSEMIGLAKRNAARQLEAGAVDNVEFHLATIDRLPLEDSTVDCVISNCVINLAPDKKAVFREIARVLKPGGRVAVSDIALKQPLPVEIVSDITAYVGCVAGAISIEDYRRGLTEAGFSEVLIVDSKADLNTYAQVENQSVCCSPAMSEENVTNSSRSLPMANATTCYGAEKQTGDNLHSTLKDLMARYKVNDYAASVKVFAIKPKS
ncbi:hypothetical protein BH18ACI4_BH18ACI4_24860 [soil metagenome]